MPKRGTNGRYRSFKSDSDHFEHDDRVQSSKRRVSFKPGTNKGKYNKMTHFEKLSHLLDDNDVDMGGSANQRPFKGPYRGGKRLMGPRIVKRTFIPGNLPWYQITIPYGAKHEKEVVLRALLSYMSPEPFIPQYYQVVGNAAIFYVDDVKVAEKLFNASRQITMSDGFKLILIVKNILPNDRLDNNVRQKMKEVMAKRYNLATKALDLTKFHSDPDLSEVFCALFRTSMMLAAIEIISENIPDIVALNLNDNKLQGLDHLKILSSKLKHLKILYLADNRIHNMSHLDSLKSLPLVELYLKGNPLIDRCSDHDSYVSDVRRKFPKLTRLDGVDLPPAIGFDVADDVKLPPPQQSFLVDPGAQDLVRQFLTQYFAIYDSESRQPLLEAYHENASLSMAANYQTNDSRNSQSLKLNAYIPSSRNLLRVSDRELRRKYLKNGKLQVVSFLSELPKSKHDLMGFSVDLTICTPSMMLLTVNGVFKELSSKGQVTRSFHRTFVVVPNGGGGFCITNDCLYVTNTTKEQEENCFKSQVPTPVAAVAPVPAANQPSEAQKMQLITTLGQHTGMNQHWSMNCLQETGWDLQRGLFIFNQLQSEGKIPPEAFVK